MHGLARQLGGIGAIATSVEATQPSADILLCLPATLIDRAAQIVAGRIELGGQDCSAEEAGAFTGDISVEMLRDAGASAVIVGHSERRHHHGETDAIVSAKAKAASKAGLLTIICIGETKSERADDETLSICDAQLAGSMPDDMILSATAVAHEPLWAIGTGRIPTSEEIVAVHSHIRRRLLARFGEDGRHVRILYGGSIKPDNAHEILALPDVDGGLIGGASLLAGDFEAIIRAVSAAH
jgi:triosephosphate isomerase